MLGAIRGPSWANFAVKGSCSRCKSKDFNREAREEKAAKDAKKFKLRDHPAGQPSKRTSGCGFKNRQMRQGWSKMPRAVQKWFRKWFLNAALFVVETCD